MVTIPTAAVVDPAEVGVDPARLDDLLERARREVDEGILPSCQLAVARHGVLVAAETIGDAPAASRYVVFSCTKALVAGAVWQLIGQGHLAADTRVADLVDGFGANGKGSITLEHLLTHTAGFPYAPFDPLVWEDRDLRRERFASWTLAWEPGSRFEYHPTAAHWVVADLVESVTGIDFRAYVNTHVLEPLGLDRLRLGVDPADQADVVDVVSCGEPPDAEELEALLGIREIPTSVTHDLLLMLNLPEARAAGIPGGGAVGDAADLANYYQALLRNPDRRWVPEVLADGTGRIRCTHPDALGVASNRTLGLVVAGDDGLAALRQTFGHTVSPRAFGHAGAGGQVAWADPVSGLSFCYLTNGLDQHALREWRRAVGLSSRAGGLVAG